MKETQARSLVLRDATRHQATKPVCYKDWAQALQHEQSPQWETQTPQLDWSPRSKVEKACRWQRRPGAAKRKKKKSKNGKRHSWLLNNIMPAIAGKGSSQYYITSLSRVVRKICGVHLRGNRASNSIQESDFVSLVMKIRSNLLKQWDNTLKKVNVAQSCPTLCNPMDYTVHEILQARILAWVAFPFSRGSSQPRDRTQVFHIAGGVFPIWATGEALIPRQLAQKALRGHDTVLGCLQRSGHAHTLLVAMEMSPLGIQLDNMCQQS